MRTFIGQFYGNTVATVRHLPAALKHLCILHLRKSPPGLGGDVPVPKEQWEHEYRSGKWRYLERLDELGRYSIIVGYFSYFKKGGALLDVGCGHGLLRKHLAPCLYSKYVGIDISSEAIRQAAHLEDEKSPFICADAESYQPDELFDAIVFNESLYYFHDPIKVITAYEYCLKDDGLFLISLYVTARTIGILKQLNALYAVQDEVTITNKAHVWICGVLWRAALAARTPVSLATAP
jgi:SAM-dependent methyltransferase